MTKKFEVYVPQLENEDEVALGQLVQVVLEDYFGVGVRVSPVLEPVVLKDKRFMTE